MAAGRATRERPGFHRSIFTGLAQVYGMQDPHMGRAFQVEDPDTEHVLLQHLKGIVPMACTCWLGAARVRSAPIPMPTAADELRSRRARG